MPADPLRSLPKAKAAFVEPMDCLPVPKLPEGSRWLWEIKLDGYLAVAVKSGGALTLYSHNKKVLNTDQWSERAATIRSELSVILFSYSTLQTAGLRKSLRQAPLVQFQGRIGRLFDTEGTHGVDGGGAP